MEGISLMLHVCNKTPGGLQSGADTHEVALVHKHMVVFQMS
jgi:hypothetical protein